MTSAQLAWNYSALASHYDHRPDYDGGLVRDLVEGLGLGVEDLVLDIGAGTGKLTGLLAGLGLQVIACEPNAEMRSIGVTKLRDAASWVAGAGEALPARSGSIALATFGSSFNVMSSEAALDECARVLRSDGCWLALWNHRDLDDPFQREVEALIHRRLPHYDYGSRRRDPASDVSRHGAFLAVDRVERRFIVNARSEDWLDAWRSHATLARQAGAALPAILDDLQSLVGDTAQLSIPYYTRAWIARRVRR